MVFVVKISLGKDIRRRRFSNVAEVSYAAIQDVVRENFGLDSFIARYRDDEGDLCALTAMTLPDALELSGGTLRLEVQSAPQEADDGRAVPAIPKHVDTFVIHTPVPGGSPCASVAPEHQDDWQLLDRTPADVDGLQEPPSNSDASLVRDDSPTDRIEANTDPLPEPHQAEAEPMPATLPRANREERHTGTSDHAVTEQGEVQEVQGEPTQPEMEAGEPSSASSESLEIAQQGPSHGNQAEHGNPADESTEASSSTPQLRDESHEQQDATGGDGITDAEKVLLVLAAFDTDGDQRLSFQETNELQRAAWGGSIDREGFEALCMELGVDTDLGLGSAELSSLYERYGTLERDFAISLVRLQGTSPVMESQKTTDEASPSEPRPSCSASSSSRGPEALLPLLAIPLVVGAPLLGLPLAFFAAKKCCQRR